MQEFNIPVPKNLSDERVPARVEAALSAFGVVIHSRSSLKQYPGCTHWHVVHPGEPGTLDVTWWPARCRLWLAARRGRTSERLMAEIPALQEALEARLALSLWE